MDPRVRTPQAQLVKMFEADSHLTKQLGEVSLAIRQAEELEKNIAPNKMAAFGSRDLRESLSAFERKLIEISGTRPEPDYGIFGLSLPGSQLTNLHQASEALNRLLLVVQGSDSAPSADAAVAIEKWDLATKDVLSRWNSFWINEKARINTLLKKNNMKPL